MMSRSMERGMDLGMIICMITTFSFVVERDRESERERDLKLICGCIVGWIQIARSYAWMLMP